LLANTVSASLANLAIDGSKINIASSLNVNFG